MVSRAGTFNIPLASSVQHHFQQQQQQQQPQQQVQHQRQAPISVQTNGGRPYYAQEQPTQADTQRMEESLKRSVTLVFWYKVSRLCFAFARLSPAL